MTFACRRATRAALVGQVAGVPALEGTRPAPDLRLAERSNIAPLETADHPAEQKPERQERRGRSERPGEPLLRDLPRHHGGRGKLGVNPHRADPGDQSHPKSRKRDPRPPTPPSHVTLPSRFKDTARLEPATSQPLLSRLSTRKFGRKRGPC